MKVLPHSQIIPTFSRTETERQNIGFGLCKFISAYRKKAEIILCTAPTSTIASVFYNFGRPDSKSVMSKTAVLILHLFSLAFV